MATNNAPKHDFAPAWLKIPNSENSKPSGPKQGETSLEDRSFNRSNSRTDSHSIHSVQFDLNRLYRQHSYEHYRDESKRFPPGPSNKFRHHSVDDDYYAYYNAGYYNGYGYHDRFGMHYSSQPTLVRNGQRDSKYQHPHARYGASQNMNVPYPPYYDFIPPYDYYNDPYYPNYPTRGGSKRAYYEKEGRTNSKEGREREERKERDGEKEKPFNDDFPSLNGDEEKGDKNGKQVNGTGVWENPPNSKNGNGKIEENGETSQSKVLRDSNIYKSLVPNKGSQPSTPPIDILNARFVTQPKTISDKKSHFLKTLRQEEGEKSDKKGLDGEELMNGVSGLNLSDHSSTLSSSLEAEQRLLREMGWNEADEEEYEITEDDMKEFANLSKQVQNQRPNGLRNGIPRPPVPKTWSPQHIPVYTPNTQELNDTLSSSDSESDADN
ncbi:vasculin-like isoform X2 [Mya arenaria]|uniref:vasculin-like isoform X2 n=1 Tax=Mya arenaria TaxID=6604 RepID=UPI0022E34E6A|nr:vasculin-like isoform X2 [Mya arenaria]